VASVLALYELGGEVSQADLEVLLASIEAWSPDLGRPRSVADVGKLAGYLAGSLEVP